MNNKGKTKIETLKRKSRRKHLINELSYMKLPEPPFLEIKKIICFVRRDLLSCNQENIKVKYMETTN
ncbi:hypothetical protein [Bacillus altitudinis]|uniref:hypothetical protein n=1 Tax=Bacillus altitudinis TaxID=293387 RepID=UPI001F3AC23A|nr:hypothetical protein [Bacillus altitudinis]